MAFVKDGPTIRFSQVCWQKMWQLVHTCKIEISWMMILATEEERKAAGVTEPYYFSDVYVVDQECDGTNTDMEEGAVGELVNQLMNENIDPGRLKGYGHSHVNMGVSPSGKDETCFERLQLEPLVSIILNKKGEVYLRLDQWEPFRHSYKCDYVVDQIQLIPDDWGQQMIDKHVTKLKPKVNYIGYTNNTSKFKRFGSNNVVSSNSYYGNWDYENGHAGYTWSHAGAVEEDDNDDLEPDTDKRLSLPAEYDLLHDSYEEGVIDINDVLTYYAKVEGGEMSLQDMELELTERLVDEDEKPKSKKELLEDPFGVADYVEFCDDDDEEDEVQAVGASA